MHICKVKLLQRDKTILIMHVHKCVKSFFGFKRFDSFTVVLIETGLPSFNTLLYNSNVIFFKVLEYLHHT